VHCSCCAMTGPAAAQPSSCSLQPNIPSKIRTQQNATCMYQMAYPLPSALPLPLWPIIMGLRCRYAAGAARRGGGAAARAALPRRHPQPQWHKVRLLRCAAVVQPSTRLLVTSKQLLRLSTIVL
jgi:hypothetical protein